MNDLPRISARRMDGKVLELEFAIAADCPWLEGHFPNHPILPGVVQVGWAAHFAAELVASAEPPIRLRRIKFRHPVLPDARLTLRLVACRTCGTGSENLTLRGQICAGLPRRRGPVGQEPARPCFTESGAAPADLQSVVHKSDRLPVRHGCEVEFEYLLHGEPMIPASSGRLGFAEVP